MDKSVTISNLARDWFALDQIELDVETAVLVAVCIEFASHAIEAIATPTGESNLEAIEAQTLVDVVRAERMRTEESNVAGELRAALLYLMVRDTRRVDWRLLLQELEELSR